MKLVIILALLAGSVFAQDRPMTRKAKKALEALDSAPSPCTSLQGQELNYCNQKWQEEKKKQIDNLIAAVLQDRLQEAKELEHQKIMDEKERAQLEAWLTQHGVSFVAEDTLADLRQKKADKQAELVQE